MDNLCHTLVGAALARTGLARRTPRATAALVLGANLPDVDVVAAFMDGAVGIRRGITHGLPAMVVLPILLTGAILLWDRWRARSRGTPLAIPRQVYLVAVLGTLTHPVLDWLNVYGMRWLMPFTGGWTYADAVFIIDPVLWLVLAVGWLASGGSRRGPERPRPARLALGISALYILAMLGLTAAGRRVVTRELGLASPDPRTLQVAPPFLAFWRREILLDAGDQYLFGEIRWRDRPRVVMYPGGLDKRLDDPAVDPERVAEARRRRGDWYRFPFVDVVDGPDGPRVRLDDARYARNGASFSATYLPLSR